MAKNGWFMAFLPIFGTENLKNDKTCERPDFLFRKTIPCTTICSKKNAYRVSLIGDLRLFSPLYMQKDGKMTISGLFGYFWGHISQKPRERFWLNLYYFKGSCQVYSYRAHKKIVTPDFEKIVFLQDMTNKNWKNWKNIDF